MKTYIGTKIIEAEPAYRCEGKVYPKSGPYPRSMKLEDGYKVRYPDGYESWSPKDVFEAAYMQVIPNNNLRTDAPSISQEMVDNFIVARDVTTMGDKCTVVRAILRNGFEIVESSACVSAENYDVNLGADICMKKIKGKVWFLLGFLLQTAVHGVNGNGAQGEMPAKKSMSFGQAIEAVREGHKVRRRGWNGKNQHIELASFISYVNPDGAVVNAEHDAIGSKAIAFCGTSGVQMGWLASQADMLADDWEIVG